MRRVYVAGSSRELARAAVMRELIERAGFVVTHDWVENIRREGASNPVAATDAQRVEWARECIYAVAGADYLVLLYPVQPTVGAWVELGAALAAGKRVIVSTPPGADARSLFTYDCTTVADDSDVIPMLTLLSKAAT